MPRITEKQIKEREVWFSQWLVELDTKLDSWLNSLDPDTRNKLDYSVESLNQIEKLILDTFDSHEVLNDKANSEMIDIFGSYIGETHRKNHSVQLYWDCDFDNLEYENRVHFFPFLNSEHANCSITINMGYTLYNRLGNDLHNRFNLAKAYFEESIEQYGKSE